MKQRTQYYIGARELRSYISGSRIMFVQWGGYKRRCSLRASEWGISQRRIESSKVQVLCPMRSWAVSSLQQPAPLAILRGGEVCLIEWSDVAIMACREASPTVYTHSIYTYTPMLLPDCLLASRVLARQLQLQLPFYFNFLIATCKFLPATPTYSPSRATSYTNGLHCQSHLHLRTLLLLYSRHLSFGASSSFARASAPFLTDIN